MNTTQGKWRCNVCNSKATQLHRAFGQWPTEAFQGLGEQDQQRFMQDVAALNPGKANAVYQERLENTQEESSWWGSGGEFLPLKVWETRGFDQEDISNHR